ASAFHQGSAARTIHRTTSGLWCPPPAPPQRALIPISSKAAPSISSPVIALPYHHSTRIGSSLYQQVPPCCPDRKALRQTAVLVACSWQWHPIYRRNLSPQAAVPCRKCP